MCLLEKYLLKNCNLYEYLESTAIRYEEGIYVRVQTVLLFRQVQLNAI